MYLHYRVLNPDVTSKDIVKHIKKKVNKQFLLKYAKYVEDTVKKKN